MSFSPFLLPLGVPGIGQAIQRRASARACDLGTSFPPMPCIHWIVIGALSLTCAGILLIRKHFSVYGAVVLGITVFYGFYMLDALVLTRLLDIVPYYSGHGIDLASEYNRLINGGVVRQIEMLKNILAFVPFGFFLSEYFSSTKRFGPWHRLGFVALVAFCLSLCIETLQLLLSVAFSN